MATIQVDISKELRKVIYKAQEYVELEEIVQPFIDKIKDYCQDDQVITKVADCLYDTGVSDESYVIPAVKVGVKIHNSKLFKDSFALALLKRCKTDFDNRNNLLEDDQLMQLNINIWFVCNLYLNCKNLETGKSIPVLYGAIVDYLMSLIADLRKVDTVRDVLLFALPTLKESQKLSNRSPALDDVFDTAEKLLKDPAQQDSDVKLCLQQIVSIKLDSDEPNEREDIRNAEESKNEQVVEPYHSLSYSLDELSAFPGNMVRVTQVIIEKLKPWSQDEEVISKTTSLIFNKAVADANFRYTAAILCKTINESSVFMEDKFRYYLLKECKNFFDTKEKLEKNKIFGAALFTAEIYLSFKSGNSPLYKLHDALLSYMKVLMTNTDKDYVKCITSLLKLVGNSMDQYEKGQGKPLSLDDIFENLKKISTTASDRSVKDIIANVVKLRESNWGVASKPVLNPNAAVFRPTSKSNNSSNPTETTKFNPNASEFYPSYVTNSYKDNLSDQQEQPVRDIATWNEYIGDDDDVNADLLNEQESMFQYLEEVMIDDDMEEEYEKFLAYQ